MSGTFGQLILAAVIYVGVVLVLGFVATRRASKSPTEYFLAGRALGPVVLFMALFGTNNTSFVLVGIPGLSYNLGLGVFGLNAPVVALGIPLTFWAIGSPAWRWARKLDALTPAELYAKRLGSPAVGFLLFFLFTLYTIPYMTQGVKSAALILAESSDGALSMTMAAVGVVVIALVYTSLGGMRATAWTNVFQGAVFMVFMAACFFLMSSSLGGLSSAMEQVDPAKLVVGTGGLFAPRAWASWGLVIALSVIVFPHMLVRLMSAKDERSLQTVCRYYPIALALLWIPAVLIGVWGSAAFPNLENSDEIFQKMTAAHLPPALGALGFLAVLSAVMSTLDAQILTLGSMVMRDVLEPLRGRRLPAGTEVWLGRFFSLGIGATVLILAITWNESIFGISRKAFEGYLTLFPTLLLGVRWARFTAAGALASMVIGNLVLVLGWMGKLPLFGFLPPFWALVAGFAAAIGVSLMSRPALPSTAVAREE
ncbi:MAG: sodium:solute symporter family protein [Thermoanaerobaculia bacterium]|nr:sodium:solute symporter family protein [Thermoanaerobaculia bacterium]